MSKEIDNKEDILQEFMDFLLEDYHKFFKNNPDNPIIPITDDELDSFYDQLQAKKIVESKTH